jgi:hypothetical protein
VDVAPLRQFNLYLGYGSPQLAAIKILMPYDDTLRLAAGIVDGFFIIDPP